MYISESGLDLINPGSSGSQVYAQPLSYTGHAGETIFLLKCAKLRSPIV